MAEFKFFPLERLPELEAAIADMAANPKTRVSGIACALGLHGLRASEVTQSLWRQFSATFNTLYVCPCDPRSGVCQPLKGGVARTVKLHQTVVDAIVDWRGESSAKWLLPNRNGGSRKSQSISKAGRDLLLSLGMPDIPSTRFHMFRHTSAMRILADTQNIRLVSKHLGHASIKTTMAYLECLDDVPESCFVVLHQTEVSDPQMKLFNPYEYGKTAS